MKKIMMFCIGILLTFSLMSCKNSHDNYRIKDAEEKITLSYSQTSNEEFKNFKEKVELFSANLTSKVYKKSKENYVISPISIYMALAMAIECANNETRDEMLNAVGVTYEEVIKYTSYIYSCMNNEYTAYGLFDESKVTAFSKLSNSIWIDDNIELKQTGLDSLSKNYNADSYYVPFKNNNRKANKALSDYLNEKTKGLIDGNLNLDSETIFVLVNTYYLKEIWNYYGNDLSFTAEKYNFTNYDSSTTNLKLLMGYYNNGKAYEEDTFSHFFTKTEHNYTINFIVPKEGYSVDDIFTYENLKTIKNADYLEVDHERKENNHTRCFFPEFKGGFDDDIKSVLIEDFRINSLFNKYSCDFSNLTEEAYCTGVIHKCSLTVNKKGIEGAAATVIPGAGAPGPGEYVDVYYDFIVDRAFGFTITDRYGFTVFAGVIKNI